MPKHQTEPFVYKPDGAETGERDVEVGRVVVTTNPRTMFDEDAIASLARSIEQDGLLQPITVRPGTVGGNRARGYELLAGERRLRAVRDVLGRDEIRANVVTKTDEEAARIRLVENFEREDLHPLEEAVAYDELVSEQDHTAKMAAELTGRSVSYVWQRIKLLELIDPARDAFLAGELSTAHALELARLGEHQQERALRVVFHEPRRYGDSDDWPERDVPLSARQLKKWIEDNLHLELEAAPWPKDDAQLLPQAGPCTTCPKRTGFEPALFPEIEEADLCLDPDCFEQKMHALIEGRIAAWEADDEPYVRVSERGWIPPSEREDDLVNRHGYTALGGRKECEHSRWGVYVDGPNRGEVVAVCLTRGDCPEHGRQLTRDKPMSALDRMLRAAWQERNDRRRIEGERAARELCKRRMWPVDTDVLRWIVVHVFNTHWPVRMDKLMDDLGWERVEGGNGYSTLPRALAATEDMTAAELLEALWILVLRANDAKPDHRGGARQMGRELGVDVDQIAYSVATEAVAPESGHTPLPEDLVTLDSFAFRQGRTCRHIAHYEDVRPLCGAPVEDDLEPDEDADAPDALCGTCERSALKRVIEAHGLGLLNGS